MIYASVYDHSSDSLTQSVSVSAVSYINESNLTFAACIDELYRIIITDYGGNRAISDEVIILFYRI